MRRLVVAGAAWVLAEQTGEGVPRGIFRTVCLTCGAESGAVRDESVGVERWALTHTGAVPGHRAFRLVSEWFLRVEPGPGNPLRELELEREVGE